MDTIIKGAIGALTLFTYTAYLTERSIRERNKLLDERREERRRKQHSL
jgi:hypothetical protein